MKSLGHPPLSFMDNMSLEEKLLQGGLRQNRILSGL